jgi:hypothetical protein
MDYLVPLFSGDMHSEWQGMVSADCTSHGCIAGLEIHPRAACSFMLAGWKKRMEHADARVRLLKHCSKPQQLHDDPRSKQNTWHAVER